MGKDGTGKDSWLSWFSFVAAVLLVGLLLGYIVLKDENPTSALRKCTRGRGNLPRVDEEGITQVEVIEGIPDMTVYDSMPLLFRASFDLEIR